MNRPAWNTVAADCPLAARCRAVVCRRCWERLPSRAACGEAVGRLRDSAIHCRPEPFAGVLVAPTG